MPSLWWLALVPVVFYSNFLALSMRRSSFSLLGVVLGSVASVDPDGHVEFLVVWFVSGCRCTLILRRDPGKCLKKLSLFAKIFLSRAKHWRNINQRRFQIFFQYKIKNSEPQMRSRIQAILGLLDRRSVYIAYEPATMLPGFVEANPRAWAPLVSKWALDTLGEFFF